MNSLMQRGLRFGFVAFGMTMIAACQRDVPNPLGAGTIPRDAAYQNRMLSAILGTGIPASWRIEPREFVDPVLGSNGFVYYEITMDADEFEEMKHNRHLRVEQILPEDTSVADTYLAKSSGDKGGDRDLAKRIRWAIELNNEHSALHAVADDSASPTVKLYLRAPYVKLKAAEGAD